MGEAVSRQSMTPCKLPKAASYFVSREQNCGLHSSRHIAAIRLRRPSRPQCGETTALPGTAVRLTDDPPVALQL